MLDASGDAEARSPPVKLEGGAAHTFPGKQKQLKPEAPSEGSTQRGAVEGVGGALNRHYT